MTCKELEKYERGEVDRAEFKRHADGCPSCRAALRLDDEVMSLAGSLRKTVEAPGLWSRIEENLGQVMAEEKRQSRKHPEGKERRRDKDFFGWRFMRLAPAAVAVLAVVCVGIYFGLQSRTPSSGLLALEALNRVEQKEQEYIKAIQDLEKQALPRMADLDLDLMFLYRERLETIDAQITQCREALDTNPANAHIRSYLMAALQDKKETLIKVLNLKDRKLDGI